MTYVYTKESMNHFYKYMKHVHQSLLARKLIPRKHREIKD